MQAKDLLTALSVTSVEYDSINFTRDKRIIPSTNLKLDDSGDLILFHSNNMHPLPIKEFFLKLMLNKQAHVYY